MDAKVRGVMTPEPIGVGYYQSIGEAARTMRDWGVGAVLVVNEQSLYGLVTDRDLVVRAVAEAKGPDEPVGPLSSGDLIGVDVDADAAEAARLMRENAVSQRAASEVFRFRARLIPHARYTTETCRTRPDTSLARFVCSP